MKDIINLKGNRTLKLALQEAIIYYIEKLQKRNKAILNSKTYRQKIINDIRDKDYKSFEKELKINNLMIKELTNLLD